MRHLTIVPLLFWIACTPAPQPAEPAPKPPSQEATAPPKEPAEAKPAITHDAKITFVDVDEGDAILIQVGDFDALVDTGSNGKWDGSPSLLRKRRENPVRQTLREVSMAFLVSSARE
ncbi:hypothetical protein ACFL6C_12015 [Myxococcota bacterium]